MPYLGNIPASTFSSLSYQDLTGGTGTNFTLDHSVSSAQDIEVFVNNVRQEPGVAYTVAGTALTMTGSIVATDDFYVVFQGKAVGTVSHPAGNALQATSGTFSGDLTVDTDTLYVDSTNNRVGINNASPTTALDVTGDVTVSGGVYLGGTGSANYLDDYEEGTWTLGLGNVYEGFSSVTALSSSSGTYTKIGNKVFIKGVFVTNDTTTITSDAGIRITGLPFTPNAIGTEANPNSGSGALRGSLSVSDMSYFNAVVTTTGQIWFTFKINSGLGGSADDNFSFFVTYETNA